MFRTIVAFAAVLGLTNASYSFIGIGDFGGAMLDPTEADISSAAQNVAAVSTSLNAVSSKLSPAFIVNTGDAFYYCGLANTTDSQIEGDWIKPFMSKPAVGDKTWYGVLGNHAYGYNPQAIVDMTTVYDKWEIPGRYYTKRVALSRSVSMSMIFLDTNPCVSDYRSSSSKFWDPCGGDYPTCEGGPMRPGGCKFNANILEQSCKTQQSWLKGALAAVPADDWLVVVGHHPAFEVDEFDLVGMLQSHPVNLYINGHSHELALYDMDGKGKYVTTGAGSLSPITAQNQGVTRESDIGDAKLAQGATSKHRYNFEWSEDIAGFTSHEFSSDLTSLTTNFHDTKGNVLQSFVVKK